MIIIFKLQFKLNDLLYKYMLSQRKVALECNIRPMTLKMYVDNDIQRINKVDLEKLYEFFYKLDDRIKITDIVDIVDVED